MPFMGQDWRAPGERWVRTHEGWERMKLRPLQCCQTDTCVMDRNNDVTQERLSCSPVFSLFICDTKRSSHESESSVEGGTSADIELEEIEPEEEEVWQPHCFVKTGKSKEFVGCTSMSEAFHKLNIGREVTEVRRFNYICKIVQILVRDKLQNLSGSARKILFAVVEAIVLHSLESFCAVRTARELVSDFLTGLHEGQHCGSPKLLSYHQGAVCNLQDLLTDKQPGTPADCGEDSVTFLDLPRECLREILRRMPDHKGLLEAAKAHEALESLVEGEQRLWRGLCQFHFTQAQIDTIREKLIRKQQRESQDATENQAVKWRHMYFELKKMFGLREVYAEMLHICCHCKALFWKSLGHPCLSVDCTSVRVTPQQFVDMLMLL